MMKVMRSVMRALTACAILVTGCGESDAQPITIDPDTRYQTIEGFGTCLVSWVDEMAALYRTEAFQRVYVEDLGFNMLRVSVWGPVMPEPVEDWREIRYEDFDLSGFARRAQVFLDFGAAIKRLNPQVKIIGSVWTPPPWMKVDGTWNDESSGAIHGDRYVRDGREFRNRVKPQYYPHFAMWMVEMAKMHAAAGAPFDALSPGNEVMFTQTFGSCVWTAEDYATIVRTLGEMLEREGLGHIRIFGPETMTGHNWSLANPLYIEKLMSDPAVARHFDVFATHGYTDGFEADGSKHSAVEFRELIKAYGRPYWMTEGGTGDHDWPAPVTRGVATMVHNSFVGGHASAFVPWQVAGRRPTEHNLMVMDRMTPKTHAMRHFSKFIRPGAVRVAADPAYGDVLASAYLHDGDATLTVVLINPHDAPRSVTLGVPATSGIDSFAVTRTSAAESFAAVDPVAIESGRAELTMPAHSIATLVGRMAR